MKLEVLKYLRRLSGKMLIFIMVCLVPLTLMAVVGNFDKVNYQQDKILKLENRINQLEAKYKDVGEQLKVEKIYLSLEKGISLESAREALFDYGLAIEDKIDDYEILSLEIEDASIYIYFYKGKLFKKVLNREVEYGK